MGGVPRVAGRDRSHEVSGGGRAAGVSAGVRRLDLPPPIGRLDRGIDDGGLRDAQPGQGQPPEGLQSPDGSRKPTGIGNARQVPDIDRLTGHHRLHDATAADPRQRTEVALGVQDGEAGPLQPEPEGQGHDTAGHIRPVPAQDRDMAMLVWGLNGTEDDRRPPPVGSQGCAQEDAAGVGPAGGGQRQGRRHRAGGDPAPRGEPVVSQRQQAAQPVELAGQGAGDLQMAGA